MTALRSTPDRLRILPSEPFAVQDVIEALARDDVVLLRDVAPETADPIVLTVARALGLGEQLELQAAFASVLGHRRNIGRNFMSVNAREDFQFISAHSEGVHSIGMQFAAFYCHQNTTDGGHTLLLNADNESPEWARLRDTAIKIDLCGRRLSPAEVSAARMRYKVSIPQDILSAEDEILGERPSPIAGTRLYDVQTPLKMTHSSILGRDVNVYWDSVASTDFDSAQEYLDLLRSLDLLRLPKEGLAIAQLDNAHPRRLWRSGLRYSALFKAMIEHKLGPGELLLHNNLTWAHSVSNWTPGSGARSVAAAFA